MCVHWFHWYIFVSDSPIIRFTREGERARSTWSTQSQSGHQPHQLTPANSRFPDSSDSNDSSSAARPSGGQRIPIWIPIWMVVERRGRRGRRCRGGDRNVPIVKNIPTHIPHSRRRTNKMPTYNRFARVHRKRFTHCMFVQVLQSWYHCSVCPPGL